MRTTGRHRGKRVVEFYGEAKGRFLVEWLNGPPSDRDGAHWARQMSQRFGGAVAWPDHGSRQRIIRLLEELLELTRVGSLINFDRDPADDRGGWEKFRGLAESVNRHLRRYRYHPEVRVAEPYRDKAGNWRATLDSPIEWAARLDLRGKKLLPRQFALLQEFQFVRVIGDGVQNGWLTKVRRCACARCGRWLFARKPGQTCCSTKCRKSKYYFSTYKEKRKRNYSAERSRELAWIEASRNRRGSR